MTQATDTPDLLAAASLLLTLITFVYGLIYPELSAARALRLAGRQVADVGPDRDRVRAARWRAGVLAVAATIVGAIFTPAAANLTWHFLRRVPKGGAAFRHYNASATTLILVTVGCFLIAGHATKTLSGLTTTLNRLSGR
jgi:hypothetical protein